VPDHLEPVRLAIRDDGQRRVAFDQVRGVDQPAVYPAGKCGARQTRADAGCDFGDADGALIAALAAVGQGNDRHCVGQYRWNGGMDYRRWTTGVNREFLHTRASRGNPPLGVQE
jgi:hypothetical protein